MDGEARFLVTMTATGEVHDADGALISSSPVTLTGEVSAEQLRAMGALDQED